MHKRSVGKQIAVLGVAVTAFVFTEGAESAKALPTPPEVWKSYAPDAGDFKEEIVREETKAGVYYKDAYISAYINGDEVRVYCKYAVKAGARNAPGVMNVHGWMGGPAIDMDYVNDGWAVMAHDYSGISQGRPHCTTYPNALGHGYMDGGNKGFKLIYTTMPDGSQLTDPTATSHYLWNAVQRRALSYLIAQKEVDADRIGAKGYSYGGTIMWNLGMDPRVKAIVAYFGIGWINYYRDHGVWMYNNPYKEPAKTAGEELFLSAIAPESHAPYITAASLWLNGSNDHHGGHERGEQTFKMFKPGVPWDFAIQPRGHHDTEKLGDDCRLWLEKHVLGKDIFWPARPQSAISLDADGVPELRLTPDTPARIAELTMCYALKEPVSFGRVWRDTAAIRQGEGWVAKLPVMNVDDYVFAFANIRYDNNIVVSSDFTAAIPATLGNAVATDKPAHNLSEDTDMWSRVAPVEGVGGVHGFRPLDNRWGTASLQFADPKYKAPRGASLTFKFYCTQPQKLILNANGRFSTDIDIAASDAWQQMTIQANQLSNSGVAFSDWSVANTIGIKPQPGADITKVVFAEFKWAVSDSLPPVVEGKVPQSVDELWAGYDPRAEPLDVKIIHEWDETYQGKALKIQMLTFTVGTFKGKASRISAYYAYPTDAKGKVPGLVQVHGGGQRADKHSVKVDAANGYASISLNWGGRELEDQKPGAPGTDWGAIDPTQKHVSHYFRLTPDDKTAEAVYSPRNNNWFVLALATRRGLTFLEQQAVVDAERLGVYGHSMGGTITGQVAGLDPRIKAAVPSCGGAGITQAENIARPGSSADRRVGDKLYSKTIDSTASLRKLSCPILGQSPQNDFNCIYDDLNHNWQVIPDHALVHFSISPHLNHRHIAESEFTRTRFFNAFLKGEGGFPARPELGVDLKTSNGIPIATVKPAAVDQVQRVQIYYSINPNSLTRYWRRAATARFGDVWKAHLPVMSTDMPLFVMANVEYPQPRPLIGSPWTGKSPANFLVSSWERTFDPPALKAAGVKEVDRPSRMIQKSFDDWGDWYRIGWPNTQHALSGTRKLTDPKWRGPDGASLTIDVKDPQGGNFLMAFDVNNWGAYAGLKKSSYYCVKPLAKTEAWQTVTIALSDLKPRNPEIPVLPASWQGITDLQIVAGLHRLPGEPKSILSGGMWPGTRQLRNLRWTGGSYTAPLLYPGGKLSVEAFQKIFQEDIDKSIELEKKDAQQG